MNEIGITIISVSFPLLFFWYQLVVGLHVVYVAIVLLHTPDMPGVLRPEIYLRPQMRVQNKRAFMHTHTYTHKDTDRQTRASRTVSIRPVLLRLDTLAHSHTHIYMRARALSLSHTHTPNATLAAHLWP